eukprot:gene21245-8040_t
MASAWEKRIAEQAASDASADPKEIERKAREEIAANRGGAAAGSSKSEAVKKTNAWESRISEQA